MLVTGIVEKGLLVCASEVMKLDRGKMVGLDGKDAIHTDHCIC